MLAGGRPDTRFVSTDLGYLAYQVFGSGPRDILFITGGVSNIDALWDEPSAVRFFDRLSQLGRVIVYDMRGSGVSDPIPGELQWLPLEDYAKDAVAVLDAVGSERAVIYGDTEGGMTALLVAATRPDRTSSLVLVNSQARLARGDDYPIGMPGRVADALSAQYLAQHGATGAMLELTAPSVAHDARFRSWWIRYQRLSVSMGLVKTTFDWFANLDVRAALPLIQAPTLVVSRRGARFNRLQYSEYMAERIPKAELCVLDGEDTNPFHAGDFGAVLEAVESFLTGRRDRPRTDRVLATVLVTDIVRSTALASSMGDQQWLDVLAEHDRIVRTQLDRFDGREVKMTGDGCLAMFDGPGRAVSCAAAIIVGVIPIGLTVRAGIHTGEVELRGDGDIGGLAVHIAARVMDHADNGGVVVSSTVRDLVVGSALSFSPHVAVSLRGIPGTWQLYALEGQSSSASSGVERSTR